MEAVARIDIESQVLSPEILLSPCSWEEIFGNSHPVEIEIGPGKGRFLFEVARQNPDRNYLGIEWASRYMRILKERLAKRNLPNVRLAKIDARVLFARWIPSHSVHAIHIYFPDPWPKKKHHKRRLFTEAFFKDVERALVPGGKLYLLSDVLEYFEAIKEGFASLTHLNQVLEKRYPPDEPENPGRTNFEIKYRLQGRPIFEAHWMKPEGA